MTHAPANHNANETVPVRGGGRARVHPPPQPGRGRRGALRHLLRRRPGPVMTKRTPTRRGRGGGGPIWCGRREGRGGRWIDGWFLLEREGEVKSRTRGNCVLGPLVWEGGEQQIHDARQKQTKEQEYDNSSQGPAAIKKPFPLHFPRVVSPSPAPTTPSHGHLI